MARVTLAKAFGHPLGPHQRLASAFAPYRRAVPPISFDLAFVSALLAFPNLNGDSLDQAPKGGAMARVTLATAFGHPLGPQQKLTSMFVPYHRIWLLISFDLAFVSDFASFVTSEARIH